MKYARATGLAGLKGKDRGTSQMLTFTCPSFCDDDCGPYRVVNGKRARAWHGVTCADSCAVWNADAPMRWNRLRTRLRQVFPAAEYFKVRELQDERGAVHYHALVVGVPLLPKEKLRGWAVKAGFGQICDVTPVRHVGGAVAYVTKLIGYVLKAADDDPDRALGRVWSCSKRWRTPDTWRPRRDDGLLKGTVIMRPIGGDDYSIFVSLPAWEFDAAETQIERQRLRRASASRGGFVARDGVGVGRVGHVQRTPLDVRVPRSNPES